MAYDASSDTGYGILGAIGYDFGMFRLEGEIGYRKNDFEQLTGGGRTLGFEGDQSVLSFMGNGYFDIETNSAFTPYFLLGLGYANVDVSDVKTTDDTTADNFDDSVFAYQFGVGVGYAVTDSVILDLNYRYFATSDLEYDALHGKIEGDCSTHNILFGIRYAF